MNYRKLKRQLSYYSNADFEKYAENFLKYYLLAEEYQKFLKLVEAQKENGFPPNQKYLRVLDVRRQKGLTIAKAFFQNHDSIFKSIKTQALKNQLAEIFIIALDAGQMLRLRFLLAITGLILIGIGIAEDSNFSLIIGMVFIPLSIWFWWLSYWKCQKMEFDLYINKVADEL